MQVEPRGLVRLSCPLGLQEAIAASLPSFLASHPMLRVQCVITNRRVDLVHEGIDVAIRVRERLDTDADLQMKRIGLSRRILVASPAFVTKHGEPVGTGRSWQASHSSSGATRWRDLAPDGGRRARLDRGHRAAHSDGKFRNPDRSRVPGSWNCAASGYELLGGACLGRARADLAAMERLSTALCISSSPRGAGCCRAFGSSLISLPRP